MMSFIQIECSMLGFVGYYIIGGIVSLLIVIKPIMSIQNELKKTPMKKDSNDICK